MFSKSTINKYRAKQAFEVPPHIFTLAETAYKALLTEQVNQAVIISGESGAGVPFVCLLTFINTQWYDRDLKFCFYFCYYLFV